MQGPIKTQERFEATLRKVYALLQMDFNNTSDNYVKLGCYFIQMNQYVYDRMDKPSKKVVALYKDIGQLLKRKKVQQMLSRLGIELYIHEPESRQLVYMASQHCIALTPKVKNGIHK